MAKKKQKKQIKKARKAPAALGAPPNVVMAQQQQPHLAPSQVTRKLDIACGQNVRDGFEGVDIFAGPKTTHVVNLAQYPWPFADNSVAELNCSHYIEHIEMGSVDERGNFVPSSSPDYVKAKDALFKFFDECYRILVPDGWLTVICPAASSDRAFQDPTHRRFIVAATFSYLWAEWRKANGLDHYNVQCDFGAEIAWTVPAEINAMTPEVQQMRFQNYRNCVHDWIVKLRAYKPSRF